MRLDGGDLFDVTVTPKGGKAFDAGTFSKAMAAIVAGAARQGDAEVTVVKHGAEVREADLVDLDEWLVEAAAKDDDHFYGAWTGGSKAEGGHPGRGATLEDRRRDLGNKIGHENVGVTPQQRKAAAEAAKADPSVVEPGSERARQLAMKPAEATPMTVAQAEEALAALGVRSQHLDRMDAPTRGLVVNTIAQTARAYPESLPSWIGVAKPAEVAASGIRRPKGGVLAMVPGTSRAIILTNAAFSPAGIAKGEKLVEQTRTLNWTTMPPGWTMAQATVVHEMGHVMDHHMGSSLRGSGLGAITRYARTNYAENWAEAFTGLVAGERHETAVKAFDRIKAKRGTLTSTQAMENAAKVRQVYAQYHQRREAMRGRRGGEGLTLDQ